ncbi:ferritin-like domain-containing protein [Acidisoma sp.]|uniref:ferritin-like domain-containing protein n=1 Tax=Acidisoma sp. TaxID=1872115 RepID=UPI003AFFB76D
MNNIASSETASRRFIGKIGAGAVALCALAGLASKPAKAQADADVNVLNFALNLEYLEAEYYLRAVTGAGLSAAYGGAGTAVVPTSTLVPFKTSAVAYWAQRIANDELAHVNFLRIALGAAAIPEPVIDLETSFTTLAVAAGLITAGQTFNPFASELDFLIGAYIFEDVGVTAYAGAAALLTEPNNIAYSASILAIEAEHAGCIRGYLASIGGGAATDAISALRQKLSGVQDNGTDLSGSGGNPFSFANDDYNGQVFRRTPQQVLNIVYGAPGTGVTSGLFFPNGVNGAVAST